MVIGAGNCAAEIIINFLSFFCALPAFLKQAGKNPHLKTVSLSKNHNLTEENIDTLIKEIPDGVTFELVLPASLISFVGGSENIRNYNLRKKLTGHFGDKVKFK